MSSHRRFVPVGALAFALAAAAGCNRSETPEPATSSVGSEADAAAGLERERADEIARLRDRVAEVEREYAEAAQEVSSGAKTATAGLREELKEDVTAVREAVDEAGIDPSVIYLTNAVKHFRFETRGKRRIHQTPGPAHIEACRPWLVAEFALLDPELVVALGATAAKALFGPSFRVTRSRGEVLPWPASARHPEDFPVKESRAMAKATGVALPKDLKKEHQSAMKKLKSASGEAFDRAYMEQMVKDHEKTLKLLQEVQKNAKDPALRQAAEKAAPEVEKHLVKAKEIAGKA